MELDNWDNKVWDVCDPEVRGLVFQWRVRVGVGPEVCRQRLLFHALIHELLPIPASFRASHATLHVTVTRHLQGVQVPVVRADNDNSISASKFNT